MQKITPFLWFNKEAEEAANFYVSVFTSVKRRAKVVGVSRYDEAGAKASGRPKGSVMTVEFLLDGQQFIALNGGPIFKFTPAVSFMIHCQRQDEVDHFWKKLSEGGKPGQCGWLEDKYGLSWQVVPDVLDQLLDDPDHVKAQRVMKAMIKMTKIDINKLKEANKGK